MEMSLDAVADAVMAALKAGGLGDVSLRMDHELDAVVLVDVLRPQACGEVVGVGLGTLPDLPDMTLAWLLVPPQQAPYSHDRGRLVPYDGPSNVRTAAKAAVRRLVERRLEALPPLEDEVREPL